MARTSMVVLEEDQSRFSALLDRVREETNAKFVYLIDKSGSGMSEHAVHHFHGLVLNAYREAVSTDRAA